MRRILITLFTTSKLLLPDLTSYKNIKNAGQGYREIWDRNLNNWKNVNCYLYMASYNDQPDIEFQVDPYIGSYGALEASTWLAEAFGRVPKIFRSCVREFWVLPGIDPSSFI